MKAKTKYLDVMTREIDAGLGGMICHTTGKPQRQFIRFLLWILRSNLEVRYMKLRL